MSKKSDESQGLLHSLRDGLRDLKSSLFMIVMLLIVFFVALDISIKNHVKENLEKSTATIIRECVKK